MCDRSTLIASFLETHGWNPTNRVSLANDASFRRYERLNDGIQSAILMDAPPSQEDVRPFIVIARHLVAMGYAAPRIFAEDIANGLLLIEDFGDNTYTRALQENPGRETSLYALAVDLLIDLHRRPITEALPANLPSYDLTLMNKEVLLFTDWYLPAVTGRPTPMITRKSYLAAWNKSLVQAAAQPRALVLRDFHVDNLIWLTARNGIQACGLLDFQDAVAGPPIYDLMSLLEDARRDISRALFNAMVNRYFSAFPDLDPDAFNSVFSILAAQRHAKVIGIFTRLSARDAKSNYLTHIPRLWGLLEAKLAHPGLANVAEWFERHVPSNIRITPDIRMGHP